MHISSCYETVKERFYKKLGLKMLMITITARMRTKWVNRFVHDAGIKQYMLQENHRREEAKQKAYEENKPH